MRGEWFSFAPTFTAWLATNHKPTIRGTDPAIWDRIALVPYTVRFRLPDEPEDARPVADPTLAEKLAAEREGILAWIVRGAVEWYRDGLGTPDAVRRATSAYRDDMDTLGDFLDERCVIDPQATVVAATLWETWKTWCAASGEREGSQKALSLRLSERDFQPGKGTKGVRIWRGVRVLGPDESPATGGGSVAGGGSEGVFRVEQQSTESSRSYAEKSATNRHPPPGAPDDRRHCWSCREEMIDDADDRCDDCGWLACRCGACGCTSEVTS